MRQGTQLWGESVGVCRLYDVQVPTEEQKAGDPEGVKEKVKEGKEEGRKDGWMEMRK